MQAHFFEAFDAAEERRPGEWCKFCNCARNGDGQGHFDRDTFSDFVSAHGFGLPMPEAFALAETLMRDGDDYATAAAEVVARDLVERGK